MAQCAGCQVKAAFQALARQCHPDRCGDEGAADRVRAVHHAYMLATRKHAAVARLHARMGYTGGDTGMFERARSSAARVGFRVRCDGDAPDNARDKPAAAVEHNPRAALLPYPSPVEAPTAAMGARRHPLAGFGAVRASDASGAGLDGSCWRLTSLTGASLRVTPTRPKQAVYCCGLVQCDVALCARAKAVFVEACTDTAVDVADVTGAVEVVRCRGLTLALQGRVSAVRVACSSGVAIRWAAGAPPPMVLTSRVGDVSLHAGDVCARVPERFVWRLDQHTGRLLCIRSDVAGDNSGAANQ